MNTFEEEFPELYWKGKAVWDADAGELRFPRKDIEKHCLCKQRTREKILSMITEIEDALAACGHSDAILAKKLTLIALLRDLGYGDFTHSPAAFEKFRKNHSIPEKENPHG